MRKVLFLSLAILLGINLLTAQDRERTKAILLNLGADSKGFSLAYEKTIGKIGSNNHVRVRGFVGYGFNSSNWSDREEVQEVNATPGSSWRTSTYYPFDNHSEEDRATYYLGDLKQYSVGIECIDSFGKRKHFFDIATGITLDLFTRPVNFYGHKSKLGNTPTYEQLKAVGGSKLASHYYFRLGYRFVSNGGLTLGTGVNLLTLEGLFTRFYAADFAVTPYLSIGYSF